MMDDRDIAGLEAIKKNCGVCGGKGYTVTADGSSYEIQDCICVKTISEHIKYIAANIPTKYRSWHINELRKDIKENSKNKRFIKEIFDFLEHIPENIDDGSGLWFFAPPGLAKSSMITYILKESIRQNYKVYWGKAHQYVDLKLSASRGDRDAAKLLRRIIESMDIIAIEEVDKVHLYSDQRTAPAAQNRSGYFRDHIFFEFLSDLYDANISILMSSNMPRNKIEEAYPSHVRDRLRKLHNVALIGKTGR